MIAAYAMILGLWAAQAHPSASCGVGNVSSHGVIAVPAGSGGGMLAKAVGFGDRVLVV